MEINKREEEEYFDQRLKTIKDEVSKMVKAALRRSKLGYHCEEVIYTLEREIEYIFDNN